MRLTTLGQWHLRMKALWVEVLNNQYLLRHLGAKSEDYLGVEEMLIDQLLEYLDIDGWNFKALNWLDFEYMHPESQRLITTAEAEIVCDEGIWSHLTVEYSCIRIWGEPDIVLYIVD